MIYLISPYSDRDPAIRLMRYAAALACVGHLHKHGHRCFSPVVYGHNIALATGVPTDWESWWPFNRWMLDVCPCAGVLELPGWEESEGCAKEIEFVREEGKELLYFPWSH